MHAARYRAHDQRRRPVHRADYRRCVREASAGWAFALRARAIAEQTNTSRRRAVLALPRALDCRGFLEVRIGDIVPDGVEIPEPVLEGDSREMVAPKRARHIRRREGIELGLDGGLGWGHRIAHRSADAPQAGSYTTPRRSRIVRSDARRHPSPILCPSARRILQMTAGPSYSVRAEVSGSCRGGKGDTSLRGPLSR